MHTIVVTGGCGYIGSHTALALLEKGYEVLSIDVLEHNQTQVEADICTLSGKAFQNTRINLCNLRALRRFFAERKNIAGIIHFAAHKLVPESMQRPLRYYGNNLLSLINVLVCAREHNIKAFIYSSSSAVYGNVNSLPVTEETPCFEQQSVYGRTKYFGEHIVRDAVPIASLRAVILRYFNPAGAHESGLLGEYDQGPPQNLVPALTAAAAGIIPELVVFGKDYPTPDGTCIRDYVHVMDIAEAHVKALEYVLNQGDGPSVEVVNLGSGTGYSVLQMIEAFENTTGLKVPYRIGPRRSGDAVAVYADHSKATRLLGWQPRRPLSEIMLSAWRRRQLLVERAVSKSAG
ncbi:MAG: UDP-glucose 4-epimerase GalE [Chitinophagales bacterium]|nr:UDP-glucose 4-epimerase GalE [Chitinophagales bacterium]MDW8428411.1 UDP-glucose 4-epimerase GalE [Chitinophagales bacterium]